MRLLRESVRRYFFEPGGEPWCHECRRNQPHEWILYDTFFVASARVEIFWRRNCIVCGSVWQRPRSSS